MKRYVASVMCVFTVDASSKEEADAAVMAFLDDANRPIVEIDCPVWETEQTKPFLEWCPKALHPVMSEHGWTISDAWEMGRTVAVTCKDKRFGGKSFHWLTDGHFSVRVKGEPMPFARAKALALEDAFGVKTRRARVRKPVLGHFVTKRVLRMNAAFVDERFTSTVEAVHPGGIWMASNKEPLAPVHYVDSVGTLLGVVMPINVRPDEVDFSEAPDLGEVAA